MSFFEISSFAQAIDVLGTYLTSSAVAPLNKEFVEIEFPPLVKVLLDRVNL